jgi:hypothetical protein
MTGRPMKQFLLLAIAVGSLFLGGCQSGPPEDHPWEYNTITMDAFTAGELRAKMLQLNQQGWEIEPASTFTHFGPTIHAVLVMRRWKGP